MQSNNYVIKNGTVFFENGFKQVDIEVEDGIIINIAKNIKCDNVIDALGKIVSPAFIDVHTHLRTPGYEYKEDIHTGSLAAVKGGYATIFSMPNTNPVIDSVDEIKKFNRLVKESSYCNIKTFAAITKNLKGQELVDFESIDRLDIAGFSDDGKGVQNDELFYNALWEVKKLNSILSVHCEDIKELGDTIGCVHDGEVAKRLNLKGINSASEYKMVVRDLKLLDLINCRYHVCHVSTKETVEIVRLAKRNFVDVSCEVTPHHLVLNETDIKTANPNWKMNPPLRSKADQKALIDGLNRGIIDIIATDHAPHSFKEKQQSMEDAPFGIIGLDQAFSVLNTFLVSTGACKMETILRAITYGPAKRFNVDHSIGIGKRAYITIIDPNSEKTYTDSNIGSKSKNTPFIDVTLKGSIDQTIIFDKIYNWE